MWCVRNGVYAERRSREAPEDSTSKHETVWVWPLWQTVHSETPLEEAPKHCPRYKHYWREAIQVRPLWLCHRWQVMPEETQEDAVSVIPVASFWKGFRKAKIVPERRVFCVNVQQMSLKGRLFATFPNPLRHKTLLLNFQLQGYLSRWVFRTVNF